MEVDIQRVNGYDDARFSRRVLEQHGAFLAEGQPYEIEITGEQTAVIRGPEPELYPEVIELFRFFAEHICRFFHEDGRLVREYPPVELFPVKLAEIQPSQFFVDRDKVAAVRTFIGKPEDIVIPVIKGERGYISLDGHTRLALAVELGFREVRAFLSQTDDYILDFAKEAKQRGVCSPNDLTIIPHREYDVRWNQFCEDFF